MDQHQDISDKDLLQAVEELEDAGQSGGSRRRRRTRNWEGYFTFSRTQFREKTAKSYGIKRTSYHLRVENLRNTFPVGHGNIVRAFGEGLANSIEELIDGLPNHDRIQIYLGSSRLRNSHTSAHVSVEQWCDPLGALRQVLRNISNLLNSNESFQLDDTLRSRKEVLCASWTMMIFAVHEP